MSLLYHTVPDLINEMVKLYGDTSLNSFSRCFCPHIYQELLPPILFFFFKCVVIYFGQK